MKTLILNGSPRKNGDTAALIRCLAGKLSGEIRVVDSFTAGIHPCCDCRYCWTHPTCAVADGMGEIYEYLKECDNVVIASPLYFSELSGPLLGLCSRFQLYYAVKRFQKTALLQKKKKGVLILTGGGDGGPEKAEATAGTLMRLLNAEPVGTVLSLQTDRLPAALDKSAAKELSRLAELLNGGN